MNSQTMQTTNLRHEVAGALGLRIATSRRKLGINQTELARRIGISRSTIRSFETGNSEPGATEIFIIADQVDCDPCWLLTGISHSKSENMPDQPVEEIFVTLKSYPKAERKRLLKLLFEDVVNSSY